MTEQTPLAAGAGRADLRQRPGPVGPPGGRGSADEPAVIDVSGLEMSYGKNQVLRGVTFEVHRGEVFCLLGPNGAGKTTTVEILEGFRTAAAGTARVLGCDPMARPQELRERTGVVLQECGFPRYIRVGELLTSWRRYYPRSRPQAELLDIVGLQGQEHAMVRKLSGGQRRRLDFALALAGDPELIFLDEPTTGYDPEARLRCWGVIENLRSLGKTIMLTTHYLDEAERLADRVGILTEGRIKWMGTPPELARQSGVPTMISFQLPDPVRRGEVSLPARLAAAGSGDGAIAAGSDRAVIASASPSADLAALLAWAAEHGLGELAGLTVAPPRLEDAYLRFLGIKEAIAP